MHDYSVEIEKMYREWEKRKNADNDRKLLAAETAEKEVTFLKRALITCMKLENAEIQERLASRLASDFELDRPIKADRGDPFCIQVSAHSDLLFLEEIFRNRRSIDCEWRTSSEG